MFVGLFFFLPYPLEDVRVRLRSVWHLLVNIEFIDTWLLIALRLGILNSWCLPSGREQLACFLPLLPSLGSAPCSSVHDRIDTVYAALVPYLVALA